MKRTLAASLLSALSVKPGDTPETLASRMAVGSCQLETFKVLNGLAVGSRLAPGAPVKPVIK